MLDPRSWRAHPLVVLGDLLIAGMGVFQLVFTFAVRAGASFHALMWLMPLVVAGALAAVWWVDLVPSETDEDAPAPVPDPAPAPTLLATPTLLACLVATAAWQVESIDFTTLWMVMLVHGVVLVLGTGGRLRWATDARWSDLAGAGAAMVAGFFVTMAIRRPEGDDGYYLAQVVANREHADLPLLSFDAMHGDVTLPLQQPAHRAQGYETFVSVVTEIFGFHPFDTYYIWLPAFFALAAAVGVWLTARAIGGRRVANVAALGSVVLLALWAGDYYTPGNFTYVRMFQGKGVLVGVYIPLLAYAALRFVATVDARSWVLLTLAQMAAAGCSSTALVVAPLGAALVVLAGISFDKRGLKLAALGVASALPVVVMLLLVKIDVDAMGGMFSETGFRSGWRQSLGRHGRSALTLAVLATLPLVARWMKRPGADWASRYVFVASLLVVNEWTAVELADRAGDLYRWRLYWALPIPTLVATMIGLLAVGATGGDRVRPGARMLSLVTLVAFTSIFVTSGKPTWDKNNKAKFEWADWRIGAAELGGAQAVLHHSGPDALVLALEYVAIRVAPFPDSPELVGVRKMYTRHLARVLGREEAAKRVRLQDFVEKPRRGGDIPWAMAEIERRCVTVLAFGHRGWSGNPGIETALRAHGFEPSDLPQKSMGRYRVWHRDPSDCQPAEPDDGSEDAANEAALDAVDPIDDSDQPDDDADDTDEEAP